MSEKRVTTLCKERANELNNRNRDSDVIYVCAPVHKSDWVAYRSGLLRKMQDLEGFTGGLRADRDRNYRVYKLNKIYDENGNLKDLEWDRDFVG